MWREGEEWRGEGRRGVGMEGRRGRRGRSECGGEEREERRVRSE